MSSLVRARGSRLRQGSVAAKYFRGRAIALATAARAERGWFKRNHDRGDQKPGIDRPSSFYVKFKEEGANCLPDVDCAPHENFLVKRAPVARLGAPNHL